MHNLYRKIYEAVDTGIQKALIISDEQSQDTSVRFHNKEISTDFISYEYRTVDMGKAGIWCEYNLGAFPGNKPENWYGDYYAWGEAETKDNYSWWSYEHCERTKEVLTKYNKIDTLKCLESKDDIITQTLNNNFRMPTQDEYQKLINNTTNKWVKNYKDIHGLNGQLFTAENGNTLFFPSAGYYDSSIRYFAGKYGYVWSASRKPYYLDSTFILYFYSDGVGVYNGDRCLGLPARGVQNSLSNQ